MVTFKQAAAAAYQYLPELLGLSVQADVRLEEIDSTKAEWLVTLSIPSRDPRPSAFPKSREYKILAVNKESGEVTSMKIREIQNA